MANVRREGDENRGSNVQNDITVSSMNAWIKYIYAAPSMLSIRCTNTHTCQRTQSFNDYDKRYSIEQEPVIVTMGLM